MIIIYNIGVRLYFLYILLGSLFNRKASLWINGRRNLFSRIRQEVHPDDRIVWFHCSSLGEFEQGRPVIEELKNRMPDVKILLTFFSPSGYEIRKNYPGADHVYYLPLDTKKNAKLLINLIQPVAAFFVKYEFWYHYIHQLNKREVPVFLFSAIFRNSQVFFKSYGSFYRNILKKYRHIFVQDADSANLLIRIDIQHVSIAGDTRFDRVSTIAGRVQEISTVSQFKQGKKIIIAGSTWSEDEKILCRYINDSGRDTKYIIAPHEIHDHQLERLEKSLDRPFIRFTGLEKGDLQAADVLLVDVIGYLSALYQYADIAYIGGGFGKGIHNTLEAATFGIPVIFGPKYQKFREAQQMIEAGSAFSIIDFDSLKNVLEQFFSDPELLQQSGLISFNYILKNTGATNKILDTSIPFL